MADEEEDPTFEEENEEIGGGAEGGQGKRKRLFSKECKLYFLVFLLQVVKAFEHVFSEYIVLYMFVYRDSVLRVAYKVACFYSWCLFVCLFVLKIGSV